MHLNDHELSVKSSQTTTSKAERPCPFENMTSFWVRVLLTASGSGFDISLSLCINLIDETMHFSKFVPQKWYSRMWPAMRADFEGGSHKYALIGQSRQCELSLALGNGDHAIKKHRTDLQGGNSCYLKKDWRRGREYLMLPLDNPGSPISLQNLTFKSIGLIVATHTPS